MRIISEQEPSIRDCAYLTPSTKESCESISAATTAVGLTTPEVVEYWNCMCRSANISAMSDSTFVRMPTVTIA